MSDPMIVTLKDVYDKVESLGDKWDSVFHTIDKDAALLKQRVDRLERQLEGEAARRWALWLALISAFVAIVLTTVGIIFK
jgi:hypothetical protein